MNDLTLIRKNLFRKKLRAILLIFTIMIAFLLFGALSAFNKGWNAGIDLASADRLFAMNRINFTQDLPYAYFGRAQSVEGVRNVSHANWFGGYYQEQTNQVQTIAVDAETYLEAYPEFELAPEQREAFLNRRSCLLVGRTLANSQGWTLGQRIPLNSNIWSNREGTRTWEFDICAIYTVSNSSSPDIAAYFHYDYFNEALAFNQDRIGWMIINTVDPAQNDRVIREVDALFANSPAETETTTEAAFNKAFIEQIGNIALIITSVIGAAFGTILMVVGTTMIMAVNERSKEVAVMKTLGFPSGRIFRIVLSESILLSFVGGFLGMGLASLFAQGAGAALSGFLPGIAMTTDIFLTSVALMLALGIATGLGPAIKAQRAGIAGALSRQ